MDQEKIAKFIKEIRIKNNLTQKDLADKYNITYQAVSKWENCKNMPDTLLIKQMSKDFNISLDDIFEGEYSKKNIRRKKIYIISIILVLIAIIISTVLIINSHNKNNDFEFKTLSAKCKNFNISGSIAYNESKSSIYITNINYCGGNDDKKYNEINCTLYESNGNVQTKINSYEYKDDNPINLDKFLKEVTFTIDNYSRACKVYSEDSLYLIIDAKTSNDDNITSYKIPLKLNDNCK